MQRSDMFLSVTFLEEESPTEHVGKVYVIILYLGGGFVCGGLAGKGGGGGGGGGSGFFLLV